MTKHARISETAPSRSVNVVMHACTHVSMSTLLLLI